MATNEKPGLLEQDRADGNKHDIILSPNGEFVKTNWLNDTEINFCWHCRKNSDIMVV